MEPAEFFDGAASADRCRFVETVVDVEAAAFTDDEPVYVMGRVMIAWRIVYFTRVARREVSSRAAFDPTPCRILRLTRKRELGRVLSNEEI